MLGFPWKQKKPELLRLCQDPQSSHTPGKGGAHQILLSYLCSLFRRVTCTTHTRLADHFIAYAISLCSTKSTHPAANPPRGELHPTAVWQEQPDLEHAPVTNVTVRRIRTVSQDKISGKQAGEQRVMALRQFTWKDSLQTLDFWERETDVSICTDSISLFYIHHSF